jgi:hypothetical protein
VCFVGSVSPWDGTNLQKPTPNAFASRRRKRRSSFGAKITPSVRLLYSVGLVSSLTSQWSKNFSRSNSKSRNTNTSSLALSELALDHSCRFACHAEVGEGGCPFACRAVVPQLRAKAGGCPRSLSQVETCDPAGSGYTAPPRCSLPASLAGFA